MPAETPTTTPRISADDARKALVGLASEPGVSKPDPIVVAHHRSPVDNHNATLRADAPSDALTDA